MADSEKVPVNTTATAKDAESAPQKVTRSKVPQVPPGFEIVKVRMPDGIIRRVQRPIAAVPTQAEKKAAGSNAGDATKKSVEAAVTPIKKDEAKTSPEKTPTAAMALADTSKSSQAKKGLSNEKPIAATPQAAPPAVPLHTRQRSSRPFFSAFAARAVTAMIPSISGIEDIGELQHGDELLDDGDDSDDFDDDDGDHDVYDNNEAHHNGGSGGHQQLESDAARAAATGLAAGLAAQPQASATTRSRATHSHNNSTVNTSEKGRPHISEKDIGDDVKPGDPETRSLHKTYSDWTRYIIWFIMISFPILFIG